MIVELVNTGSELMLGRVLNTHQQWLCGRLADLGRDGLELVAAEQPAGFAFRRPPADSEQIPQTNVGQGLTP